MTLKMKKNQIKMKVIRKGLIMAKLFLMINKCQLTNKKN
jgi:hypothetical protein